MAMGNQAKSLVGQESEDTTPDWTPHSRLFDYVFKWERARGLMGLSGLCLRSNATTKKTTLGRSTRRRDLQMWIRQGRLGNETSGPWRERVVFSAFQEGEFRKFLAERRSPQDSPEEKSQGSGREEGQRRPCPTIWGLEKAPLVPAAKELSL